MFRTFLLATTMTVPKLVTESMVGNVPLNGAMKIVASHGVYERPVFLNGTLQLFGSRDAFSILRSKALINGALQARYAKTEEDLEINGALQSSSSSFEGGMLVNGDVNAEESHFTNLSIFGTGAFENCEILELKADGPIGTPEVALGANTKVFNLVFPENRPGIAYVSNKDQVEKVENGKIVVDERKACKKKRLSF